jgi:hypothetical protein
MPRPGCEWEDRPRFDPPAFPEAIDVAEHAAGFRLPDDFRAFLELTSAVTGMSVHNGYWIGSLGRLSVDDFPKSVAGEPATPVGTDGGGNGFLLLANGRVWRWDHESGGVSEVAPSFGAFLERVVSDWTAYINDVPRWDFLV